MTNAVIQFESARHVVRNALGILAMSERAEESSVDPLRVDAGLVAAALNGDGDGFGRIVELHQSTIAAQMRRFSRDQTVIEELVHDVFVETYMSLKSYRASAPLLHWLRKIAVRVDYRYWKRQSRKIEQSVQLSVIEEKLEQLAHGLAETPSDAGETLGDLLEILSVPDRLVLTLIYWDGCSVAEAAELAGWSQVKVKVQAYRARNRLRKLIEESLK